jgi:hypothetical protein
LRLENSAEALSAKQSKNIKRAQITIDARKTPLFIFGFMIFSLPFFNMIGFSKPGASHPVPPATIGALRSPVFSRLWR